MLRRLLISLIFFSSIFFASYYFFSFGHSSYLDEALKQVKINNFAEAEKIINDHSKSDPRKDLYIGYIELIRGNFEQSDLLMASSLKSVSKKVFENEAIDIVLARAANAFFTNNNDQFFSLVDGARNVNTNNNYLYFFQGLKYYIFQQYGKALNSWSYFQSIKEETGSDWFRTAMENLFSKGWLDVHMAHCLAEEGDLLSAREILESGLIHDGLSDLFIGLTYLKEAKRVSLDERGSYYKIASFYFGRSGCSELYHLERNRVISHIETAAQELLINELEVEKQKWGFDLIRLLIDWKADSNLKNLSKMLAEKIVNYTADFNMQFCDLFKKEFLGSQFHTLLVQDLLEAMTHSLKNNEMDDLYKIWSLVEALTSTPTLLAKDISSLASAEIVNVINKDDDSLTNTYKYLGFLGLLNINDREREKLSQRLFLQSKSLWQQENQEKKGKELMNAALNLCFSKELMLKEIALFLRSLYVQAEDSNLISRLVIIHDAMDSFQISKCELVDSSKLANHLADAEHHYNSSNYLIAKANAMWVLKVNPNHRLAQKLAGLSAFHLGEYSYALSMLSKVNGGDEVVSNALSLSQVFLSRELNKNLASSSVSDTFDSNE